VHRGRRRGGHGGERSTGRAITLRPTAAFRARFGDVPREKLPDAGREVMALSDAEIFEEVSLPPSGPAATP